MLSYAAVHGPRWEGQFPVWVWDVCSEGFKSLWDLE